MRRGALPAREQCAEKIRGPSQPPYPHPSRRPWLGIPAGRARCARVFPASRRGGFCALCRSLRAGDKGSLRRFAPLRPLLASGPSRSPPPALPLGGWGWGSLPSLSPAPGGRFRRSLRRWGGRLPSVAGLALWGCVVASLSRVVGFVPVVSVALRSARCRVAPWGGSALGLSFRRSRRSLSGFVAVARFSSFAAASRFARSWGRRLPPRPGFCAVRAVAGGFAVSVPVCRCLPPCRSGLRRLLAALAV
jgi:hypothetical protein